MTQESISNNYKRISATGKDSNFIKQNNIVLKLFTHNSFNIKVIKYMSHVWVGQVAHMEEIQMYKKGDLGTERGKNGS